MFVFVFILLCSIWMIYYFIAYAGYFPYFEIFDLSNSIYLSMLHGACAKWAVIFGIFGLFYSITALFFGDRFKESREDYKMQWGLFIFYAIISLLLLL